VDLIGPDPKTVVSAVLRVKERYRQPMVFAKTEKKTHIN
jgi:hypothetical protein